MKVLMTGGAGFIGSHMVDVRDVAQGHLLAAEKRTPFKV